MRTFIQQHPLRMLAGLVWLSCAMPSISLAQQVDTVRRDAVQQSTVATPSAATDTVRPRDRELYRDNIYRLGKRPFADTLNRQDFKSVASDVAELDDCDTTFQTFILVRRQSPWRVGLFAGPNFAYCGTWENTFGPNRRDNSLYNGAGINVTANVDYFLTRPERRLRFGVGGVLGYQNYVTRRVYRDFLFSLANARGISSDQVLFKQRASDDFYIALGPVVTFNFSRNRTGLRTGTFLELGLRGGLFRTEAATITASVPSQADLLIRSVNPSTKILRPGGILSLGVFFPLRNNWHIGVQAQGFYTRLNYLIVNGIDDQLLEFSRKHGGFSAGIGVRKGFIERKLIPKAPIVCPVCDSIPQLSVRFANNNPLAGLSYASDSLPSNSTPVISWRSTTVNPRNETFTARLHYKADTLGAARDTIIAQVENTTDTTLTFPQTYLDSAGRPARGFYYVTVHNRQEAKCGTCMSEVATASFTILGPRGAEECEFRHRLERLEVYYRTPYTREIANVCYCNGQITSVGDTVLRLRYRTLNRRLAEGVVEFDTNTVLLNINQLPGTLAQTLQTEKSRIESGNAIRYRGRRVRPQVLYFRAVFTVTKLPCNGQPEQPVGSFNTTISDDTFSITDLKPLTDDQKARLLAPPAPARKAPARRRAGNSGRRSDVSFDLN
ncbi:hypothetical protein DYU11_08625 [Fibrisoma montanum]|uniref:Outer membrane protein beta-barrel domain-containing protein n=1 Tax=Fibrisoma montanum TaxID=2305895 RepID=A0A418MF33_9BACT|nr:hypothetical protein [Fibrisoma montanum]RIV25357.1 hypothetical protein DYU11_08625 [Fibrisoma montanum]